MAGASTGTGRRLRSWFIALSISRIRAEAMRNSASVSDGLEAMC